MTMTFRELIIEALARANIVPRKRVVPEDIFTDAKSQLQGILTDYSNRNFITAYRDEVDFHPIYEKMYIGIPEDYDPEQEYTNDYVIVENMQDPVSALFKGASSNTNYSEMNFISYDQFYSMNNGIYTITWTPESSQLWRVIFKPQFISSNWSVKLIYNKVMEFQDDDKINLPPQYVELLIRALAFAMSIAKPRTDTTKTQQLGSELEKLEKQIMAKNASQRILTRRDYGRSSNLADFMSGRFIIG